MKKESEEEEREGGKGKGGGWQRRDGPCYLT